MTDSLPPEVLSTLAIFLTASDLARASRVSKTYYLAFTPLLWRTLRFSNTRQETFDSLVLPLFTSKPTPGDIVEPETVKPDAWCTDLFRIDYTDHNLDTIVAVTKAIQAGHVSKYALESVTSLALDLFHIYPETWFCTGVASIISFYSPRSGSRLGTNGKGGLPGGLNGGNRLALTLTSPTHPIKQQKNLEKQRYDSRVKTILAFFTPERLQTLFPNLSILKVSSPITPAASCLARTLVNLANPCPKLDLDWTFPLPAQIVSQTGSIRRLTIKYIDPDDDKFRQQLAQMTNLESLGLHFQANDTDRDLVSAIPSTRLLKSLTKLTQLSIAVDNINPLLFINGFPDSVEFLELSGKPDPLINSGFCASLGARPLPHIKTLHINMSPLILDTLAAPIPFTQLTELVVADQLGKNVDVLFFKHNPQLRKVCFRSGLSAAGLEALTNYCPHVQSLAIGQSQDTTSRGFLFQTSNTCANTSGLLESVLSKLADLEFLHFSCTSPLVELERFKSVFKNQRQHYGTMSETITKTKTKTKVRMPLTVYCTVRHDRSDFSKLGQARFALSIEECKNKLLQLYPSWLKFVCSSRLPGHSVGVTYRIET